MKGQGALFIDVRSKERFERRHLSGAVNMPLAQLGQNRSSLPGDKDAPVIAVCDVGNVSLIGMLYLKSLGHRNVKSMNGGTTAWAEQGLPTE
jgi:rhodanese-related sulfurtransferase